MRCKVFFPGFASGLSELITLLASECKCWVGSALLQECKVQQWQPQCCRVLCLRLLTVIFHPNHMHPSGSIYCITFSREKKKMYTTECTYVEVSRKLNFMN